MRKGMLELSVLALLALCWTAVALRIWPCWDDAWIWLASRELSPHQVALAHGNRPLHGWIEGELLRTGTSRKLSAILHPALWFATGAVARGLWRRLFPERPGLGLAAGLVAMSPIFVTTQIVLINPTWSANLPTLLFWLPFVLLWPMSADVPSARISALRVAGIVLGAASLLLGCMLSEYAVAAGLSGAAFALALGTRRVSGRIRVPWVTPLLVVAVALVGYAMLRGMAHGTVRANAAPAYLVSHLAKRATSFPFFLATSVWQGVAGTLLSRIGGVRIEQAGMERVTSLAVAVAVSAAAVTFLRMRGPAAAVPHGEGDRAGSLLEGLRPELALAIGIAAGMVPFCLTARIPSEDSTSRYFLPVLPMLAVLAVALATEIARSAAVQRAFAAVLVGTAAYWSVVHAGGALRDRRRVQGWARELRPHVGAGPTLVVLSSAAPWPAYTRDYELTARLRLDLRRESAPAEVWASRGLPQGSDLMLLPPSPQTGGTPRLRVGWYRGKELEEPLARIVWATVQGNERLAISPIGP